MTPTKPLLVGGFVLGGIAIAVVAILAFGSMHLFSRTFPVVGVFRGSVSGLNVGSPVTFRGVYIGKVERMQVQVDVLRHTGLVPVYMELEPDKITFIDGVFSTDPRLFQDAVNAGLRAQLRSDSLVTGQLSIDLDFYPGTAVVLNHLSSGTPEVPTMPSDMQNLKDEVRDMNLPGLAEQTRKTLVSMQHLLDQTGGEMGPLAESLRNTSETARLALVNVQANSARTLAAIDLLAVEGRGQIATNGRDMDQLLHTAQATVTQADTLVGSLNDLIAERSPLRDDLQASVRDLAASAASLRTFTRELERDPARTLFKEAPP